MLEEKLNSSKVSGSMERIADILIMKNKYFILKNTAYTEKKSSGSFYFS